MIRARFRRSERGFQSVSISGHAGYDEAGRDIVCAAVTSALQLCANGVTEILGEAADVSVGENEAAVTLPKQAGKASYAFLAALQLHLSLLREEYPDHIEIIISEV